MFETDLVFLENFYNINKVNNNVVHEELNAKRLFRDRDTILDKIRNDPSFVTSKAKLKAQKKKQNEQKTKSKEGSNKRTQRLQSQISDDNAPVDSRLTLKDIVQCCAKNQSYA